MAVEIMRWPIALGVKGLFRNASFLEMGAEQWKKIKYTYTEVNIMKNRMWHVLLFKLLSFLLQDFCLPIDKPWEMIWNNA